MDKQAKKYAKHLRKISRRVERYERKKRGRPKKRYKDVFTEEQLQVATVILSFHASLPPPCICGHRKFKYGIYSENQLYARCRQCRKVYYFMPDNRQWFGRPSYFI